MRDSDERRREEGRDVGEREGEADLHFLNLNVEWERWFGSMERKLDGRETAEKRSHPRLDRHFDPSYEMLALI